MPAPEMSASRWPLSLGFAARLGLATSALIVAVSLTQSWVLAGRSLAHVQSYLEERGRATADHLAREGRRGMLAGNVQALRQLAEQARAQAGVVYSRFFDAHGLLLATAGSPVAASGPGSADVAPSGPLPVGSDVWEFRAPLITPGVRTPIGTVAVGISLEPLEALRRRTLVTAVLFTTAFTVMAVLCALLLARAITRPLAALAGAADAIGRGDFDTEVPVVQRDELGRLAQSFNAMVHNLARSRNALEEKVVELERANRLKSEFLASVSHELRTPLNVILGYSEMLAQGAGGQVSAEQAAMLEAIQRYSKLQLDLVTNVLDFARLSAGRVTFHVERFELEPLLTEIQALYRTRLAGPDVQLTVSADARLPVIESDRVKVQEIVRNLVDNAVKFTVAGTVAIVARPDAAAGTVIIEVSDTGAGIVPEEIDSIFDPFHQVGASATRGTGGIGLGLSIVRQLAEALGGSASVTSRLGEGSTFRVTLPVRLALPGADTTPDAGTALDEAARNAESLAESARPVRLRAVAAGGRRGAAEG